MSDWYLIQCKSREEDRAKQNFAMQGVDSYLPKVSVRKVRAGKHGVKQEPLFPGYLFIQIITEESNFNSLRSTRGVAQFVRTDGVIKPIPAALVHSLMSHEDSDEQRAVLDEGFNKGDKVEFLDGPYQGVEAIYQCADGLKRSILLLNLLSKKVEVVADNREIKHKPAGKEPDKDKDNDKSKDNDKGQSQNQSQNKGKATKNKRKKKQSSDANVSDKQSDS